MSVRFSLVYPTRHRPDFIRQALRILETQLYESFEVIVSDNYVDPALSCEDICRESPIVNLKYVRPPQPVGMVENWNYALQFATGDYICYLTDKMFLLPDALGTTARSIDSAGGPEIVNWTTDVYAPASYRDYFGGGRYWSVSSDARASLYQPYSHSDELNRRGRALIARGEQSPSDYCRGKIVFGAYGRDLTQRIVDRCGALFHNINPDYTSMVLGLSQTHNAIELAISGVVSVNTDISNGMLSDTSDIAALAFLNSLEGGLESILPNMFVPGLYASVHNSVASDLLNLKRSLGLEFEFTKVNWLVHCSEDIYRPGRQWSDGHVETVQKTLLLNFIESLGPTVAAAVQARFAERAALKPARRSLRDVLHRTWQRLTPMRSPSIESAIADSISYRNWAHVQGS